MISAREQLEELVVQCRLDEAATSGAYALAGDDRGLARILAPDLLACRSAAAVATYRAALGYEPAVEDDLCAAAVLAWSGDARGTYALLRSGRDRALAERRFHYAAGACERLAHHALLFGDVKDARAAIDEAVALARPHRLPRWHLRCVAVAARLALDAGDLERAGEFVESGRDLARSAEERALFAPSGAQLAVELGDDSALRTWTSPEILDVALRSQDPQSAIAATVAALIGVRAGTPDASVAPALRRALLLAGGAANATDLYALAARYGDLEEARLSCDALGAVLAPDRPYVKAHRLLARAHLLLRSGERTGWIDSAGDAARAFNAMGLRRWTNDAMLLLVAQEPAAPRRQRGRHGGPVLTGREQQVANLIRRGARNREVAVALQISEHTVERHVSSILGRLGLRSRWQIADPRKEGES